jgi:uncharacterized protein (DUF4415 family)
MSDRDIEKAIATDPDTRATTAAFWKDATFVMPAPKHLLSLRVDPETIAWFKAQGKGYQTRMNAVLRAYMKAHSR